MQIMKKNNDWWRGAIIYQVYPRSFQDSNGDGVGDLPGIVARLDHIAGLGAEAVWLSPFFKSPMRDFGYDVSDYCDVDPLFGTLDDFDNLVARARELGLKVLIDLVLSHTSDKHPWFEESRASRDNPRADWYVWADAQPDGSPPNNWLSIFGGSAWQWDTRREQYYLHNFLSSQPDLNFHCPDVQDAVLDVANFWLQRGVSGFRLDTVNFYVHDRQLRSNPAMPADQHGAGVPRNNPYARQRHLYDKTQPENLIFLNRLRRLLDAHPGAISIGEIGDDLQYPTLAAYTLGEERLHMAYVFTLLTEHCQPTYVHGVLTDYLNEARNAYVCWSLGNHDVARVVSRWQDLGGTPQQRARLLAAFLMSLPGAVCIYQGEELALPESDVPFELLQDPYGQTMWPDFKGRDGCRTPMPWEPGSNGGFSQQNPWLPVNPEHVELCATRQADDANSVLSFYRQFIAWRKQHPALHFGDMELLPVHDQVVAFRRTYAGESMLCAFNLSDRPAQYPIRLTQRLRPCDDSGFESRLGEACIELGPTQAFFAHLQADDIQSGVA
ncbi:alpha-glucosidase family protein [Paraburkholderia bryophila]|uniref:Alpha-glucosidase n=1 Tax=Paraburkholderia bryophila TaxID=420952 RepID=A0A7Y9W6C7_9BURK|nr:alpha-glucosidase family protein [Paraburkholderia bryophila]NYH14476.1 alpha-glucosidase [Paraburkholderia bryophila]